MSPPLRSARSLRRRKSCDVSLRVIREKSATCLTDLSFWWATRRCLSKERRCALSAAGTSVAHPGVHELVSRTGARAAEEAPRVLGSVEHAVPLGVTEVAGPFRLEVPLGRGLRPRSLSGGTRIRGSVCLTPHLPGRYAEPPSGFIFRLDFDPQRKGRSAHRAAPSRLVYGPSYLLRCCRGNNGRPERGRPTLLPLEA
ncbi:hypothetical protein MRX96_019593 [Rhipicephalus microplus]